MIHMKCQDLFSLKKKNILECRLLQILHGALSDKRLVMTAITTLTLGKIFSR